MRLKDPYIYMSSTPYSITRDGKRKQKPGIHAIFAAEVPFIPSFLSADFVGPLSSGSSRLQLIINRQVRFINDLAAINIKRTTFDLRLVFRPPVEKTNHQPGVQLLFLGKAFHPGQNKDEARKLAIDLWKCFSGHFPLEDPFNYPLKPVDAAWLKVRDKLSGNHSGSSEEAFESHVLTPIPLDSITADRLSEIRKFEDWDGIVRATLGVRTSEETTSAHRLGYFVHNFRPTLDASGFSRLLETLVQQQQKCLVRISLRPTFVTDRELQMLNQLLSEYQYQLADTEGWIRLYKEDHLNQMKRAFSHLMAHRRHLFSINIQVVGEKKRPDEVVAELGSEFMNNQSDQPQHIREMRPSPGTNEIDVARDNLLYMEHEQWGKTKGGPELSRLPILVSGYEAAGAFRLPLPPESGYMPGISVRDEPFVQPQGMARNQPDQLELGRIKHRGTDSGENFHISLGDLERHLLIAGSTGSGKTNTCLHLLSQLWGKFNVPFLVIYPIAKSDYRLLMADPSVRDDLLIFTAGDRPSPLRFNPFDIPEGILLQTHISNMMRTFETSLHMWSLLRMLFRKALRELYLGHGWKIDGRRGDDSNQRIPNLADFHEKLKKIAGKWSSGYKADTHRDLQHDSQKKIQDLLESAGSVLNVSYPEGARSVIEQILEKPAVIELGKVGSASDISLVVGFLFTLLTEHVHSRYQRDRESKQHVTLIEEAHRLMPAQVSGHGEHMVDPRVGGAEDFANILSEIRGFGEAIMIAEQTPTKLIQDAIANTQIKIMHWLEDHSSFNLFSRMLNLNERQQQHARTIEPGEVIVRAASGYPALARVPFYKEILEEKLAEKGQSLDQYPTTDDDVKAFMQGQIKRFDLHMPEYEPWSQQRSRSAEPSPEKGKEASPSKDNQLNQDDRATDTHDQDDEDFAARIRKEKEKKRREAEERLGKG